MDIRPLLPALLAAAFVIGCGEIDSDEGATDTAAASVAHYQAGRAPANVGIADVDGDSIPDIIVSNTMSNDLTVLLGDGKGGFTPAAGSPFAADSTPRAFVIGDFNNDHQADLAVAGHDRYLTILLGDGHGGLTPVPHPPIKVDRYVGIFDAATIATSDLNNDGNLDLVTNDVWESRDVVLHGDGHGGFAAPEPLSGTDFYAGHVRIADVNVDRRPDIIATHSRATITVLLGQGEGRFIEPEGSPFPCNTPAVDIAVGDIGADGTPDIVLLNSPSVSSDSNGVTILQGNGHGIFRMMPGSPFPIDHLSTRVAIGDVNGDNVGDIAVSSMQSNSITLFLMSAHGGIASRSIIGTGRWPHGIAVRDLDNDGKAEIVVTNAGDNRIEIIPGR